MAACRAEVPDIPAILRQAAELDGVPVADLIRQATEAIEGSAEPDPSHEPEEDEPPTVPLWDSNRLYVRHIGERAAWRMVDSGTALGIFHNGWTTDHGRNDLPLIGVELRITRAVLEYSSASLDDRDAKAVAGELGDTAATAAARAKLEAWPTIGDDLAPRVGVALTFPAGSR